MERYFYLNFRENGLIDVACLTLTLVIIKIVKYTVAEGKHYYCNYYTVNFEVIVYYFTYKLK